MVIPFHTSLSTSDIIQIFTAPYSNLGKMSNVLLEFFIIHHGFVKFACVVDMHEIVTFHNKISFKKIAL